MVRFVLLLFSHGAMLVVGFAAGIYVLPILTAPKSPDAAMLQQQAENAAHSASFERELRGSDFLHWGEGTISISPDRIVHQGSLAPGPDYKAYLVTEFVEHEDEFLPLKEKSALIGDVKSFEGFVLEVPDNVDTGKYNTVLIWCETFGEFITAAKYR